MAFSVPKDGCGKLICDIFVEQRTETQVLIALSWADVR